MPLETATFIHDLVPTNPVHTDGLNAADAHLRLLKSVLQAQFAGFTTSAALASTQAQIDAIASAYAAGALTLSGALTAASAAISGIVSHGAGTAAAPSVAIGEAGTGLYRPAAGQVGMTLSGVLAALLSSAGFTLQAGDVNVISGAFKLNGTNIFPVQSGNIGAAQVLTAAIANANVTYAKIQNVAAVKLLGNPTGSAAAPSEITLGGGLKFSGTSLTAPATPPRGTYINKTIQVLTNTTVSVSADAVVVSDGTNFTNVAVSRTLTTNLGLGLDQLDSTTVLAAAQFLYIYAIYNGTLVHVVASASSTAPNLTNAAFSGYTAYAYLGAILTAPASTNLMGTWQYGKRTQYVVGLAQTTAIQKLSVSTAAFWTAASVSAFVPPTAVRIFGSAATMLGGSGTVGVAPNGNYGTPGSANPPPVYQVNSNGSTVLPFDFLLESGAIYWGNAGGSCALCCLGWEDNI